MTFSDLIRDTIATLRACKISATPRENSGCTMTTDSAGIRNDITSEVNL